MIEHIAEQQQKLCLVVMTYSTNFSDWLVTLLQLQQVSPEIFT